MNIKQSASGRRNGKVLQKQANDRILKPSLAHFCSHGQINMVFIVTETAKQIFNLSRIVGDNVSMMKFRFRQDQHNLNKLSHIFFDERCLTLKKFSDRERLDLGSSSDFKSINLHGDSFHWYWCYI